MPERPLILFAQPTLAEKETKSGRQGKYSVPSYDRQVARLSPKFDALRSALDRGNVRIVETATAVDPEYTLVFETAGDPQNFYNAVKRLQKDHPNVEWVMELASQAPNSDDFFVVDKSGQRDDEKSLSTKIFCILTDRRALSQILSLWEHFRQDSNYKFPHGFTGFRNLFTSLKDVHQWGIQERIEDTGLLDDWQRYLFEQDQESVSAQIELFYRSSVEKRSVAEERVRRIINASGGTVLQSSTIPEIRYHALLARIPRNYAEAIVRREETELVLADEIMFIKANGQSIAVYEDVASEITTEPSLPATIIDEPIVAVFDGVPQENHPLLADLLSVDDVDNYADITPVSERIHGTSMASLILRGENMESIRGQIHKVYIRPIMKSKQDFNGHVEEYIPDDFLLVDKMHECIRRLFEPVAGCVAPTVRVVNLSIGIMYREYFNLISPLARLLDWLSYKYRILFIVSAGNHSEDVDLGVTFSEYSELDTQEKDFLMAKYISNNYRNLRLLSPAESMNALTVGASFNDTNDSNPMPNQTVLCSDGMVAPYSSFGRGINRAIKPDILYSGGRNYVVERFPAPSFAGWRKTSTRAPGIKSAFPSDDGTGGARTGFSYGTSNSAALVSNKAAECFDVLNEVFVSETGDIIPYHYSAVLVKAMLAHGASYGRNQATFIDALNLSGSQSKSQLHKFLGYGEADIDKVKECAKNQITLIGYGDILQGEAFEYNLPLPFDFHTQKYKRKLIITLAYFSPIHPESMKYREKQVWITIGNGKVMGARSEYDFHTVQRGTLQHEVFESEAIDTWSEEDSLSIKVNCRGDASVKNEREAVPYALLATFELAPEYDIDVYQKVVEKIRLRNPITPRPD